MLLLLLLLCRSILQLDFFLMQTTIGIIQNLYRTSAKEGDNISEHLNKLRRYWERINLMADNDFKISDNQFKVLISSSLPTSWDIFTEGYVGHRRDVPETDPKKLMSSQQFIGIIKEEAIHCTARRAESSHQSIPASESSTSKAKYCVICKRNNHNTSECRNRDKKVCSICKKPGHNEKDCWHRDSDQKGKRKQGRKGGDAKRQKTGTTNEAKEDEGDDAMQIEEVTFTTEETHDILTNPSIDRQQSTLSHVNNIKTNDKFISFYDWLADSATTSHICNQKSAFISYKLITGKNCCGSW